MNSEAGAFAMETIHFDLIVVGGGAAGLAAACHAQICAKRAGKVLSIGLLEKGAQIGSHILSGALLDTRILQQLLASATENIPQPKTALPVHSPVVTEELWLLQERQAHSLPLGKRWQHGHCHILSLGELCRWLAEWAEELGIEILTGFAAVAPLWDGKRLLGVQSGEQGRNRAGARKANYQPAVALLAPVTIIAEGCRGQISGQIYQHLGTNSAREDLRRPSPQRYALGIKELWETDSTLSGQVLHTLGWPLRGVHGGGFLYHPRPHRTALGMVIDLGYRDPGFDPFVAVQKWKTHPLIQPHLHKARLLGYGARTLTVGGWQSLSLLSLAGGLLVGDSAGLLNTATLQGIHNALASGMLAAETAWQAIATDDFSASFLQRYAQAVRRSPWGQELYQVRNVRPVFRHGLRRGLLNAAWEYATKGKSPWSWRWQMRDRQTLQEAQASAQTAEILEAPRTPSLCAGAGVIADRQQALSCSGLYYEADQPLHLQLEDPQLPVQTEGRRFGNPELRYCPAGVYALRHRPDGKIFLHIHADHCLHCKCCDIKDPLDNIRWTAPEGGSGPNYPDL
ncbi:electron transfer flavoprotein-ubiquinone oxidoreductase [Candidatus Magnetaquicoccus inordinatus]|uniref:electron transfer flavoprotein-ubiquinone oxidoreductase n=1 Tax=Candidatus Magnetaquicoccus inordinatus TaxID=2496818 RepID=UPI00102AE5A9|nr:electron-transfer flavoprotein:ubiquinone oxidoreductase [Candidatus Magnetaquicoccus inordinatus]